jgi:hypothetical protein
VVDRSFDDTKEDTMITPGSTGDWVLFAGMLGLVTTFATLGHRWILKRGSAEEPTGSPRDRALVLPARPRMRERI